MSTTSGVDEAFVPGSREGGLVEHEDMRPVLEIFGVSFRVGLPWIISRRVWAGMALFAVIAVLVICILFTDRALAQEAERDETQLTRVQTAFFVERVLKWSDHGNAEAFRVREEGYLIIREVTFSQDGKARFIKITLLKKSEVSYSQLSLNW